MNTLLIRTIANGAALYTASMLFRSVQITSNEALLVAAFILTLVNMLIRPILLFLTLPITLLTLGLFTLIINTWMVVLADRFTAGLTISSFTAAFFTGILVSVLNIMLQPMSRRQHR